MTVEIPEVYDRLGGAPFLTALKTRERRIHLKAQRTTFTQQLLRKLIEDMTKSLYYETVRDMAKYCHVHDDEEKTACFYDSISDAFIRPDGTDCDDTNNTGSMEARYGRGEEDSEGSSEEEARPEGEGNKGGGQAGNKKAGGGKAKPGKGSQGNRNRPRK